MGSTGSSRTNERGAAIQRTYSSRLIEKTPRVTDIVSFRLERPQGYEYQAGQWFVLSLPGPTEPHTHHFSHSSSPLDPDLEFTTRLRGTDFKNVLDALPLGTEVELEGPYGAFTLPDSREHVAFVSGGIGITCVLSMLRWIADARDAIRAPHSMVLLFANHSEESIPFRDELKVLETRLPNLRVVNIISEPGKNWAGYRGHIGKEVLERELREAHRWVYYLSGPPAFGQTIREQVVAWGADPARIKVERFEGY